MIIKTSYIAALVVLSISTAHCFSFGLSSITSWVEPIYSAATSLISGQPAVTDDNAESEEAVSQMPTVEAVVDGAVPEGAQMDILREQKEHLQTSLDDPTGGQVPGVVKTVVQGVSRAISAVVRDVKDIKNFQTSVTSKKIAEVGSIFRGAAYDAVTSTANLAVNVYEMIYKSGEFFMAQRRHVSSAPTVEIIEEDSGCGWISLRSAAIRIYYHEIIELKNDVKLLIIENALPNEKAETHMTDKVKNLLRFLGSHKTADLIEKSLIALDMDHSPIEKLAPNYPETVISKEISNILNMISDTQVESIVIQYITTGIPFSLDPLPQVKSLFIYECNFYNGEKMVFESLLQAFPNVLILIIHSCFIDISSISTPISMPALGSLTIQDQISNANIFDIEFTDLFCRRLDAPNLHVLMLTKSRIQDFLSIAPLVDRSVQQLFIYNESPKTTIFSLPSARPSPLKIIGIKSLSTDPYAFPAPLGHLKDVPLNLIPDSLGSRFDFDTTLPIPATRTQSDYWEDIEERLRKLHVTMDSDTIAKEVHQANKKDVAYLLSLYPTPVGQKPTAHTQSLPPYQSIYPTIDRTPSSTTSMPRTSNANVHQQPSSSDWETDSDDEENPSDDESVADSEGSYQAQPIKQSRRHQSGGALHKSSRHRRATSSRPRSVHSSTRKATTRSKQPILKEQSHANLPPTPPPTLPTSTTSPPQVHAAPPTIQTPTKRAPSPPPGIQAPPQYVPTPPLTIQPLSKSAPSPPRVIQTPPRPASIPPPTTQASPPAKKPQPQEELPLYSDDGDEYFDALEESFSTDARS
ncbi:hypothetical protein NEHOM01_2074 [Nematocida homosporus]|uniref:uncharacterized protein n=1 Tax=Nematocida homosporus TaxID=1912981 RepID=UPI0022206868|nr:uncharacterized protein NEHOM01_2074 [Nematocida homosporus]KAI5187296.1 hypothetical protein NEHOM01_2074 [Nematocida homosporus]